MADAVELRIDTSGMEAALKQLEPKRVYEVLMGWYGKSTVYVRSEMRARAPGRLKGRVAIRMDTFRPPRWAVIRPGSRLTHLIEYGTGSAGAPGVTHVARHWPSTEGIMAAMGLPRPEAFAVARSIGLRGGNPARPFIQPTFLAIQGRVVQMMAETAQEVLR